MDPPTTTPSMPSKEYGIMEEKKDSEILAPAYDTEVGIVQEYGAVREGIELQPKPTTDPLDPLNFSRGRKWACLAIVMTMLVLPVGASCWWR